jgi:hypothetical protein
MNCGLKVIGDSDLFDGITSASTERTEENHENNKVAYRWEIFEPCSPEIKVNRGIKADRLV